jgi:hypothetical protein
MKTTLQSLLTDKSINSSKNDVTWASGWDWKIHTAQYRLGSEEARSFVGALGKLGKGTQKAILKELQSASSKAGGGVGSVAIISGEAAKVFEGAAKKLGLELDFEVNRKRAPAPMG